MDCAHYDDIRGKIRIGDVVATADDGLLSRLIRRRTGGLVSHVAIVFRSLWVVELMEAVKAGPIRGVIDVTRMSLRVRAQEASGGRMYWLPLSDRARDRLNADAMLYSLTRQRGTPYDWRQALGAGFAWIMNRPSARQLFCSESVALALMAGGVLPHAINYSEQTPDHVVSHDIYARRVQLCGSPVPLP